VYFLPRLVLLFSFPSFAAAQPPEPAPATTIHARSNLVVVDVTVLDAQQNSVHHLTAGDFKIFEDGRIQTVKNFEEHNANTEPPPSAPMPKLDPGTYTNRTPVPASGPPNVLLIDYLNTPSEDRPYLRNHVLKFLKQMRPGTQVAIFGIGDHLSLLQGFTTDVDRLCATIVGEEPTALSTPPPTDNSEARNGNPPAGSTDAVTQTVAPKPLNGRSESPALKQVAIEALKVPPYIADIITMQAVSDLSRYLASLPDRKNFIWFSESFPPAQAVSGMFSIDPAFAAGTANTSNQLGANRVAAYPIDATGLATDLSGDATCCDEIDSEKELMGPIPALNDLKASIQAGAPTKPGDNSKNGPASAPSGGGFFMGLSMKIQNMRDLADKTGGRAFFNTNDLAAATELAVEAGSNYYTLTYVPSKAPEGILPERTIKVEVARKDVSLFYRNKYQVDNPHTQNQASHPPSPAAPSNAPPGAATGGAMRVAMVRGAPEPAQIVFQVSARPTATDPEPGLAPGNSVEAKVKGPYRRYTVHYNVAVDNLACSTTPDGIHHCSLQILALVYDSYGGLVNTQANGVKLAIPAARYDAVLSHGIEFKQEISVPQSMQDGTLRVGILDVTSGRIGALELPIAEVAKLTPVSVTQP
jgi:VWFA-related protein